MWTCSLTLVQPQLVNAIRRPSGLSSFLRILKSFKLSVFTYITCVSFCNTSLMNFSLCLCVEGGCVLFFKEWVPMFVTHNTNKKRRKKKTWRSFCFERISRKLLCLVPVSFPLSMTEGGVRADFRPVYRRRWGGRRGREGLIFVWKSWNRDCHVKQTWQ